MGEVVSLSSASTQLPLLPAAAASAPDWSSAPVGSFAAWRTTLKAANGYAYDESSMRVHTAMWARFVAFLTERGLNLSTAGADALDTFFRTLRGRRIKPGQTSAVYQPGETPEASTNSRRRYAQLLHETFEHLVKLRLRRSNPMTPLMALWNKPEAPGFVSFLKADEERAFLAHVRAVGPAAWERERNRTMLLLLYDSGMTQGEAVNLHLEDVALDDYAPSLQLGKRGLRHAHAAPIGAEALPALKAWLTRLGEAASDTALFPRIEGEKAPLFAREVYTITRAALEASGFTGKQRGPHTLRNTFIRRQIYFGKTDEQIMQWTGLQSERTLRKIRRTLPNSEGARPA